MKLLDVQTCGGAESEQIRGVTLGHVVCCARSDYPASVYDDDSICDLLDLVYRMCSHDDSNSVCAKTTDHIPDELSSRWIQTFCRFIEEYDLRPSCDSASE